MGVHKSYDVLYLISLNRWEKVLFQSGIGCRGHRAATLPPPPHQKSSIIYAISPQKKLISTFSNEENQKFQASSIHTIQTVTCSSIQIQLCPSGDMMYAFSTGTFLFLCSLHIVFPCWQFVRQEATLPLIPFLKCVN